MRAEADEEVLQADGGGKTTLEASRRRYPLLERLIPTEEARTV